MGGCTLVTSLDFTGGTGAPDASVEPPKGCSPSCEAGHVCAEGKCVCPANATECDGECVGSLLDAGYCNACGVVCRADQHCTAAGCMCDGAQTNCGAECADLSNSVAHCGTCETACASGQLCIGGQCKSSPCDGLCSNPEALAVTATGLRSENLGTAERCFAVKDYEPTLTAARIVCWSFDSTRQLMVNGQTVPCTNGDGYPLPAAAAAGWYCVQVTAGEPSYAGILLPTQ